MLQICKANFEIVKDIMPFEHALQKYSQCCQAFHNCKMEQRGICVFDVSSNREISKVTESRFAAAAAAAAARSGPSHIGVNVAAAGVRRFLRSFRLRRCLCRFPELRNGWQHTLHFAWAGLRPLKTSVHICDFAAISERFLNRNESHPRPVRVFSMLPRSKCFQMATQIFIFRKMDTKPPRFGFTAPTSKSKATTP